MGKQKKLITKIANNKVIQYLFSSYATYIIQFINSLFIAISLGPYYLGVWGFISLILQYIGQLNFGITNSTNTIVAIHRNKNRYAGLVLGTSVSMLTGLSLLLVFALLLSEFFNFDLGEKYSFSEYSIAVVIIGIMGYFRHLFNIIFRLYGRIYELALSKLLVPLSMSIAIFIFKGEELIWALLGANALSFIFLLAMFVICNPIKFKPVINFKLIKSIQIKGWYLFLYNASFYLIILSTKSFISAHCEVKEFGYFTFAFSLANAILLLFNSLSFLIYPKMLNRMAKFENAHNHTFLKNLRDSYMTSCHFIVQIALFAFPIFIYFFPIYINSITSFGLISLTIVLSSNSFGYQALLIAKGKEKLLSKIALLALFTNLILLFVLTETLHLPFSYIIFSTMITYLLYIFFISKAGRKVLKLRTNFRSVFMDVYPIRIILPFLVSILIILNSYSNLFFIITIILFILLNMKHLISLKKIFRNLINNPEITDI